MSKLRIELLSDLCTSSGEIYNSTIHTDVCYDSYGFPYIPAKRLKGCLREAAQELNDWGDTIEIEKIFGKKENQTTGELKIANAKLEHYDSYVQELSEVDDLQISHKQSVLKQFTYLRTQTKIENSGVAADTSLRTTRVMKKGLVFEADVEVGKDDVENLKKCCKAVRHMGINRTRGMGEVQIAYIGKTISKPENVEISNILSSDSKNRLEYTITLKSPVLFKSMNGGQERCEHYIEGAKIIGLVMGYVDGFQIQEIDDMIFSNAYISDGKQRFLPIAASVYQEKGVTKGEYEKYCELLVERENENTMQSARECFVNSNTGKEIEKMSVNTQLQYHHSRPEDKSIGRATAQSDTDGQLFQMESLAAGQQFKGYIIGNQEQIKKIAQRFFRPCDVRMGYGRTAEYGQAVIRVDAVKREEHFERKRTQFVVKLESPAIVYNENGTASTDSNVLLRSLKEKLFSGKTEKDLSVKKQFLKYRRTGGFNVTWGRPKPVLHIFDMGTTFLLQCDEDAKVPEQLWVGERNQEGYGEVSIYDIPQDYEKEIYNANIQRPEKPQIKIVTTLVQDIKKQIVRSEIEKAGREKAEELKEKYQKDGMAAVNTLLLMQREQPDYIEFIKVRDERFIKKVEKKERKREIAELLTEYNVSQIKQESEYASDCKVTDEEVYEWYYQSLLRQARYICRTYKVNSEKGDGENAGE